MGRKEHEKMGEVSPNKRRYVLAAALGTIAGGLLVALAARAIPKMMSQAMSGMMRNMMAQMREAGFAPEEI